jgi:hypothetical protein
VAHPQSYSHSLSSHNSVNRAFAPQFHHSSVAGVNPGRSFVASSSVPSRSLSPGSRSPTGRAHV